MSKIAEKFAYLAVIVTLLVIFSLIFGLIVLGAKSVWKAVLGI